MRALTLTQPWATLVALGAKQWETRSWRAEPALGERIAIHAAKGLGPAGGKYGATDLCMKPAFAQALRLAGYVTEVGTPDVSRVLGECGRVLATAVVTEFARTENIGRELFAWERFSELEFGDYSPGRWAWRLEDVVRLDRTVQASGALGLFELPGYVVDRVVLGRAA